MEDLSSMVIINNEQSKENVKEEERKEEFTIAIVDGTHLCLVPTRTRSTTTTDKSSSSKTSSIVSGSSSSGSDDGDDDDTRTRTMEVPCIALHVLPTLYSSYESLANTFSSQRPTSSSPFTSTDIKDDDSDDDELSSTTFNHTDDEKKAKQQQQHEEEILLQKIGTKSLQYYIPKENDGMICFHHHVKYPIQTTQGDNGDEKTKEKIVGIAHIGDGNDNEEDDVLIVRCENKITYSSKTLFLSAGKKKKKKRNEMNECCRNNILSISRPQHESHPILQVQSISNSTASEMSDDGSGGIGVMIADFGGIGGYQQILFLPPPPYSFTVNNNDNKKEEINQKKKGMKRIIQRSIMTDGHGLLLFNHYIMKKNHPSPKKKTKDCCWEENNDVPILIQPSLQQQRGNKQMIVHHDNSNKERICDDECICTRIIFPSFTTFTSQSIVGHENKRKDDNDSNQRYDVAQKRGYTGDTTNINKRQKRYSPPITTSDKPNTTALQDKDNTNTSIATTTSPTDEPPAWQRTIQQNIKKQIFKYHKTQSKIQLSQMVQKELVAHSRTVLGALIGSSPSTTTTTTAAEKDDSSMIVTEEDASAAAANDCNSFKIDKRDTTTTTDEKTTAKLEMTRLVYTIKPSSSISAAPHPSMMTSSGLSISLDLEVDIVLLQQQPMCSSSSTNNDDIAKRDQDENSTTIGPKDKIKSRKKKKDDDDETESGNTKKKGAKKHKTNEENSEIPQIVLQQLHEIHLSCSPSNNNNNNNKDSINVTVRTQSGVVPILRPNECVTIICTVFVEGWTRNTDARIDDDHQENGALSLDIHAMWKNGFTNKKEDGDDGQNRSGMVLGQLRLPLESILLSTTVSHIIDFTKNVQNNRDSSSWRCRNLSLSSNLVDEEIKTTTTTTCQNISRRQSELFIPKAIFEYRNPRVLTIDVSRIISDRGGNYQWKQMVNDLNQLICGSGRVDLDYNDEDSTRVRLVVWSAVPEERVGIIELILKYLPEHCNVIAPKNDDTIDDETQSSTKLIQALVSCIQNEADALKRHRMLKPEEFRIYLLKEMADLQCMTDDIASRIRNN